LAEEPVVVVCSDGKVRLVHPKSYHALAWLDSLDRQHLTHAAAAAAAAESENASAEELKVHALAPLVSSLAVRMWLWILTTPGAGLPFDEALETVDPPPWTKAIAPADVLAVFEAHVHVNHERLQVISRAFPSETGGGKSRLPLAGFVGALAHESGQDARLLMRSHSLGKLFAMSVAAAETAREARKRAEDAASRGS
jgi:hypothetical protein